MTTAVAALPSTAPPMQPVIHAVGCSSRRHAGDMMVFMWSASRVGDECSVVRMRTR